MLSLRVKARSLLGTRLWRLLNNSTHRWLTLSAPYDAAQNVYKNENECLVIKWNDGNVDEFPHVYLRENCRCPACYTDERKSRTMYSPKEVNLDITAESAVWNTEDDQLEVNWEDGHTSYYSFEWLKYLRYVVAAIIFNNSNRYYLCKFVMICIIEMFRNVLSLTYLAHNKDQ
jgi:DUF971 family protein